MLQERGHMQRHMSFMEEATQEKAAHVEEEGKAAQALLEKAATKSDTRSAMQAAEPHDHSTGEALGGGICRESQARAVGEDGGSAAAHTFTGEQDSADGLGMQEVSAREGGRASQSVLGGPECQGVAPQRGTQCGAQP